MSHLGDITALKNRPGRPCTSAGSHHWRPPAQGCNFRECQRPAPGIWAPVTVRDLRRGGRIWLPATERRPPEPPRSAGQTSRETSDRVSIPAFLPVPSKIRVFREGSWSARRLGGLLGGGNRGASEPRIRRRRCLRLGGAACLTQSCAGRSSDCRSPTRDPENR